METIFIAPPRPTGVQLRNRALAAHDDDPDKAAWYQEARAAVLDGLVKGPATIEECLTAAGLSRPDWMHPNAVGAVAGFLSKEGRIVRSGHRQASQPQRRRGVVVVWELA